ncbi:hypothetical protein ACTXG7_13220 [Mycolicibacterium sp. Dal123E01]|uniref:hypothetical protein n=1 Tax=Mycolicibacterium sp. Dal123E01 TaxID=3457578 RepID=UPI00403EA284
MADRGQDPSLLLLDYEMLRDDDRSVVSTQVQSFSIGIATLGLLGALVVRVLDDSKSHLPDFALVGAPLIPLSLFVYMVTMAPPTIIRSFYGRLLERQLHEHFARRGQADGAPKYDDRLQFPSLFEISVGIQRLSRGSSTVRVFVGLLALLVTLIFCGVTAVLIFRTDSLAVKLAAIPFYAITISAMVWHTIRLNVNGREYFFSQIAKFQDARNDRLQPKLEIKEGRSPLAYLILPRPGDIGKWLFFPLGALISFVGSDAPFEPIRFMTMLFVLEYLLYSARYQINDIRGMNEDAESPQARDRGRLPVDVRGRGAAIRSSLWLVTVRLYGAVVLAVAPSLHMWLNIVIAAVLIAISTVIYEWLRGMEREFYRDNADSHPTRKINLVASAITVIVGMGYAIRIALGLCFYPRSWSIPHVLVPIVVYAFCLGIIFVSMTWALEGLSYLSRRPRDGRRLHFSAKILEKPHLLQLTQQLSWRNNEGATPIFDRSRVAPGAATIRAFVNPYGGADRITWQKSGLTSRWGQSLAVSGISLGYLTSFAITQVWYFHIIGILSGLFLALFAAPSSIPSGAISAGTRIFTSLGLLCAVSWVCGAIFQVYSYEILTVAFIGWISLWSVLAMFINANYADLINFVGSAKRALNNCLGALLRLVIGRSAANELDLNQQASDISNDDPSLMWPNDADSGTCSDSGPAVFPRVDSHSPS